MMRIQDFLTPTALRNAAPALFLLVLVVAIAAVEPGFGTPDTLLVILADTTTLFTLAAGVTFVILLGSIDLSIPSVASLSTVIVALLLPRIGVGAFAAALAAGAAAGLVSGFVHVKLRVPSFIATLATGGVVGGVALFISDARNIAIAADTRALLDWITDKTLGVPNIIGVGLVALAIGVYLQRFSRFGRYSLAIGAGEPAAWAAGIRVNRQKILAFMLSGSFAALAGIMLAARLASGSPTVANQLLLPAISAVLVGGTAITGGIGGIGRTLVGALTVSVVRIGMTFLGVNIFAQQVVFGAVLILAVAVTLDRGKIQIAK
jgi:ribose transport system permease protein